MVSLYCSRVEAVSLQTESSISMLDKLITIGWPTCMSVVSSYVKKYFQRRKSEHKFLAKKHKPNASFHKCGFYALDLFSHAGLDSRVSFLCTD